MEITISGSGLRVFLLNSNQNEIVMEKRQGTSAVVMV